jgi:hypothetical protein
MDTREFPMTGIPGPVYLSSKTGPKANRHHMTVKMSAQFIYTRLPPPITETRMEITASTRRIWIKPPAE